MICPVNKLKIKYDSIRSNVNSFLYVCKLAFCVVCSEVENLICSGVGSILYYFF
jgi:hypothetical protein